MLNKTIRFITTDIWRIRLARAPRKKSLLLRPLRICILAVRGFDEDKCSLKASALTFYTLLSIVPVMAMFFGIAKGFGFERLFEEQLLLKFQGQEEVIQRIIAFANNLLANTRGGLIAGIGVVFLFWTVIKLLGNIEYAFNDIWGIKKGRSLGRKLSDYLSAMLVCPVLVITAGSVTVAITGQVSLIMQKLTILQAFGPLLYAGLKILPYLFMWVLFSFLYIFIPNSRVHIGAGIMGGIAAGTLYQVIQGLYISLQISVAQYNAVYGGFAALPLFLVWLQISWLIVLLGAEIAFACQNEHTYEFEPDCLHISHDFKQLLSLRVANLLVVNFQNCGQPQTADSIVRRLDIPVRLAHTLLDELVACGIISEIKVADEKSTAYQPACNVERLTIRQVVDTLERHGNNNVPVIQSAELEKISTALNAFRNQLSESTDNIYLKDISNSE